ncbi:MAG: ion transporter [Opitutales bacterium]|nr:ion transporter [Opitutales bacterium]
MDTSKRSGFRRACYRQLEPSAWPGNGLSPVNKVICLLIVAASVVAIAETETSLHGFAVTAFFVLELFFTLVFTTEYVLRLIAVGENPKYAGFGGRIRYVFSFWAILDLLAILPFIVSLGSYNTVLLRVLRLVRILRLARLGRLTKAWDALSEAVWLRRLELTITTGAAGFALLMSSSLLYIAEASTQPETFGSIPRAFWWSVATLTTVGYGDVTPVTSLGRVFAGMTAIAGIGLVAMPAGILAAAFTDAFQRRARNTSEEDP